MTNALRKFLFEIGIRVEEWGGRIADRKNKKAGTSRYRENSN